MVNAVPMSQSRTIQTKLILPPDTNHHHSIFGGKVLAYIDEIAAIASMKHAKSEVVTASIDSVDFVSPAYAGEVLELDVRVTCKNLITSEERLTTESFITMVAIDENGKTSEVPPVYPETEFERRLFETGPQRREHRKAKRAFRHENN